MHAPSTTLKLARRQTINVTADSMVRARPLFEDGALPLVVEPELAGVDAPAWIERHGDALAGWLPRHGAILFRGFGIADEAAFHRAVAATGVRLMSYIEKATPREHLGRHIYTSTYFPQEYAIALHNELSYVKAWPGRIFFCCTAPAATGGATPLADVRRVLGRIDPAVRDEFHRRGWQLARCFGSGMGPSWRHAYAVESVDELERYLRAMDVSWQWLPNGWLRTRQVRPAIHTHPRTGDALWFNHVAFWHASSLHEPVRRRFEADFGVESLPYNTYYGDGGTIPDDVAAHLRDAYACETVAFPWRKGDFLIADNMLIAHGRAPFTGERRVLAAMGDAVELDAREMAALRERLA
ncbi:TauD/TfdA family dioxygenase [Burkholderia pseudomallei]|uniref:TauD/TfdA family dioxygenase n=1 Tax=Burkholderia pseudomallei TaxID=28450 RepID=UPI0005E3CFAE|nr:TauD/TfdA family dioxygenase [Burkholderia pseudomallei]CAK1330649.1 SyrP-like protein [Burkholderia pseudomallei]